MIVFTKKVSCLYCFGQHLVFHTVEGRKMDVYKTFVVEQRINSLSIIIVLTVNVCSS